MDYLKLKYHVELLENDVDFFIAEFNDRLKNFDPTDIIFTHLVLERFHDQLHFKKDSTKSIVDVDNFLLVLQFVDKKILEQLKQSFYNIGISFGKAVVKNQEWITNIITRIYKESEDLKSRNFWLFSNWDKFSKVKPYPISIERNPLYVKGYIPTRDSTILSNILNSNIKVEFHDIDPVKITQMCLLVWFLKKDILANFNEIEVEALEKESIQNIIAANPEIVNKTTLSGLTKFFINNLSADISGDNCIAKIADEKLFKPLTTPYTQQTFATKFYNRTFELLNRGFVNENLLKYIYLLSKDKNEYTPIVYSIVTKSELPLIKVLSKFDPKLRVVLEKIILTNKNIDYKTFLTLAKEDLDLALFQIILDADTDVFENYNNPNNIFKRIENEKHKVFENEISVENVDTFIISKMIEYDPFKVDISEIVKVSLLEKYREKDKQNWIKNFNTYNLLYKNKTKSIAYLDKIINVSDLDFGQIYEKYPMLLLNESGISFYVHDLLKKIGMVIPSDVTDLNFYIDMKNAEFSNFDATLETLLFKKENNKNIWFKHILQKFDTESFYIFKNFLSKNKNSFIKMANKLGLKDEEIKIINDII
ncbi:virion protein [Carp edema virus]|nr:virion protein [Carp edema virus]